MELNAPDALRGEEIIGGSEAEVHVDAERELVKLGSLAELVVIRVLRAPGPPGCEEEVLLSRDVRGVNCFATLQFISREFLQVVGTPATPPI